MQQESGLRESLQSMLPGFLGQSGGTDGLPRQEHESNDGNGGQLTEGAGFQSSLDRAF
jgi:hypothetical protein